MSPAEWIEQRKWKLRELVTEAWGDEAAATVASVVNSYISQETEVARLHVEVRELRQQLRQYEPEQATVVHPGPTWTGD